MHMDEPFCISPKFNTVKQIRISHYKKNPFHHISEQKKSKWKVDYSTTSQQKLIVCGCYAFSAFITRLMEEFLLLKLLTLFELLLGWKKKFMKNNN